MTLVQRVLVVTIFLSFVLLFFPLPRDVNAQVHSGHFDIVYIWNDSLSSLLDYKEQVERLLGPQVTKKLKVVGQDGQYGLIYDRDGSEESSARIAVSHSEVLRKAGLEDAAVIKDERYHELYNVSYGLGKNLDVLKTQYSIIYGYLGSEVGKNLFIEKTDSGNYSLIYRLRSDRRSTADIAHRHEKLLRSKGIPASITLEDNNEIVHGESSLLNDEQEGVTKDQGENEAEKVESGNVKNDVKVIAEKIAAEEVVAEEVTAEEVPEPVVAIPTTGQSAQQINPENYKVAQQKTIDSDLEERLEQYIKSLRKSGLIAADERTAWLVYDFTSGTNLVNINVSSSFQAASMIKPFVALAYFHLVKDGSLTYGSKGRSLLEAMIQHSSNSATNWVMKTVGGPAAVQKILKQHYGTLFLSTNIVEYIPANGQTYKNTASPEDYGRFLKALWGKDLPYGKEIRRLMALPGGDRLYHGTPIPQGTMVYNKTGTTAHLCGDMGILVPQGKDGRRYPYSIVGIIEKKNKADNFGRWTMARGNVIRKVSTMIYSDLKGKYGLL